MVIAIATLLSLPGDGCKQALPQGHRQAVAGLGDTTTGGALPVELGKPTEESIPQHLPAGIE